jgi:RNA polymerase sigma factor (sigma-70 family)
MQPNPPATSTVLLTTKDIDPGLLQDVQAYLECLSNQQAPHGQRLSRWERFYQVCAPLIRQFALARGVPKGDLGDCLQDVWLALITSLRGFRYDPERGQFNSWLFALVRSKAIDLARKQCRHASESLSGREEIVPAGEDTDPLARCEGKHQREIVRDVMAELWRHLPPRSYDVLFLRSIKDLEVTEVARVLELTPAQVRQRHHRAKKKFHDLLKVYSGMELQGLRKVVYAAEGKRHGV